MWKCNSLLLPICKLENEGGQYSLKDLEGRCSIEGLLKRDNEEETLPYR
jgi:hypothetical protein